MMLLTQILSIGRHIGAILSIGILALAMCDCAYQSNLSLPEDGADGNPAQEDNGACFKLELRIGFDDMDGSRSDPEPQTPELNTSYGNEFENTINTLSLFVYDDSHTLIESVTFDYSNSFQALPFTATSKKPDLTLWHNIENIKHGKYTVYVAANLSSSQREEIKSELDEVVKAENPTKFYTMPGNHLFIAANLTSNTDGMAMSCNEPASFEFTPSLTAGLCTFQLKRIVSKVLVTANTDGDYVKVEPPTGEKKPKFSVKLEDISFTVNSVNKQTFLYQRATPQTNGVSQSPYVSDPNMSFTTDAQKSFVYNTIDSWSNFPKYFKKVKRYAKNIASSNDTQYEESIIYIPENTFEIPSDLNDIKVKPEQQVTHVIVRAKITPLALKVKKGLKAFAYGHIKNPNESELYKLIATAEDAATDEVYTIYCSSFYSPYICELSLRFEDFLGGFSNTTFFVKNKDIYTYSAAKYELQNDEYTTGENNTTKLYGFEVYNDGFANYKVFIKDPRTGLGENQDKWKYSQIFRNTYYILCIDKFVSLGQGLDPNEDYIKVHTNVVPYNYSWKGQIEINDETPTN